MTIHQEVIGVVTRGQGLMMITEAIRAVVARSGVSRGLCTVFVQHTSASLLIQENADPTVQQDLQQWLDELAPERRLWQHSDEGPDDMPAHAKSALTKTSESIPIMDGQLTLGTWQALYLWEHRRASHRRSLVVHISGE
jgi:secondary thiamine-phosphate synthase enzyme